MKIYIEGDGEIPNYYRFGALKEIIHQTIRNMKDFGSSP